MLIRIAAITLIFICTTVGWGILGSTILYRSSVPAQDLRSKVANTWGSPHEQKPPTVSYSEQASKRETITENGKTFHRTVETTIHHPLPLQASNIKVGRNSAHRPDR